MYILRYTPYMDVMGLWFWNGDMSHHGWLSSKWRRPWTCSWLLLVWAFCGIDDTCLNTAEMHAGLHLFSYLYAISNHTHITLDRNTPITSYLLIYYVFSILHYLHSSEVCIRPQISFWILPPGHKCWLPSRVSWDHRVDLQAGVIIDSQSIFLGGVMEHRQG